MVLLEDEPLEWLEEPLLWDGCCEVECVLVMLLTAADDAATAAAEAALLRLIL